MADSATVAVEGADAACSRAAANAEGRRAAGAAIDGRHRGAAGGGSQQFESAAVCFVRQAERLSACSRADAECGSTTNDSTDYGTTAGECADGDVGRDDRHGETYGCGNANSCGESAGTGGSRAITSANYLSGAEVQSDIRSFEISGGWQHAEVSRIEWRGRLCGHGTGGLAEDNRVNGGSTVGGRAD